MASMTTGNTPKEIGARVRDLRKRLGWTQEQLGREARASTSVIHSIETGRFQTQPYTLPRIAEALGVSLQRLIGEPSASDYEGTERRYHERRHADPQEDVDAVIARLVELSPQELARILLSLPPDKAQQVLAAYHQHLADQAAQASRPERRIR